MRKWDKTNPEPMVRCDDHAQVEEEERTTDGLVDPSFKEAAGRSEITLVKVFFHFFLETFLV